MGRHQQRGVRRPAHLSLGAAAVAGVMCSATYAFAAPAAAPVTAPVALTSPVVVPVVTTAAPVRTAKAEAATAPKRVRASCDLTGPPVFGDPAHPDRITNRDCGYVDTLGHQRSRDAWIDEQLLGAGR